MDNAFDSYHSVAFMNPSAISGPARIDPSDDGIDSFFGLGKVRHEQPCYYADAKGNIDQRAGQRDENSLPAWFRGQRAQIRGGTVSHAYVPAQRDSGTTKIRVASSKSEQAGTKSEAEYLNSNAKYSRHYVVACFVHKHNSANDNQVPPQKGEAVK
jgi:hypothetical protein